MKHLILLILLISQSAFGQRLIPLVDTNGYMLSPSQAKFISANGLQTFVIGGGVIYPLSSSNGIIYAPWSGGFSTMVPIGQSLPLPKSCIITNFSFDLDIPNGAGTNITAIVYTNGAASPVKCTILGGETTAYDSEHVTLSLTNKTKVAIVFFGNFTGAYDSGDYWWSFNVK